MTDDARARAAAAIKRCQLEFHRHRLGACAECVADAVAHAVKERDKWKNAYESLLAEADRQGPPMYSAILARAKEQAEEIARLRAGVELLLQTWAPRPAMSDTDDTRARAAAFEVGRQIAARHIGGFCSQEREARLATDIADAVAQAVAAERERIADLLENAPFSRMEIAEDLRATDQP